MLHAPHSPQRLTTQLTCETTQHQGPSKAHSTRQCRSKLGNMAAAAHRRHRYSSSSLSGVGRCAGFFQCREGELKVDLVVRCLNTRALLTLVPRDGLRQPAGCAFALT
jgi:hypothetical protein